MKTIVNGLFVFCEIPALAK